MTIVYNLLDLRQQPPKTTALAVVHGIYYDSECRCAIISCADGSHLIKRMSVKYYADFLMEYLAGSSDPQTTYTAVTSVGVFMKAPPNDDPCVFALSHGKDLRNTIVAKDTGIPDSERKGQLSTMALA